MKLIVGLGNPGPEYEQTRHNIGFMVVEHVGREIGAPAPKWTFENKWNARVAHVGDVMLMQPQTYMNASGTAVKKIVDFYKLKPSDIWVVHDDIDLPVGKIRIREGGSSAGHKGVDSIIAVLGTDKFLRFRLGIGRGKENLGKTMDQNVGHRSVIKFVLSRFGHNEAGEMRKLIKHGTEAVKTVLFEGLDRAMNRFN